MKRATVFVLGFCVLSSAIAAQGGELTDPKQILEKARAAVKKLKTVSYTAKYGATAWIVPMVPSAEGTVVVGKQSKWELNEFLCEVKLQMAGSEEILEYTAGSDGDLYFLIDPKTKTAYEDMDPAVMGSNSRNVQRVVLNDFAAPEPFAEAIKAETLELKGTTKIGDEECYEIYAKGEQPPEYSWFFSTKDLLPRRVIRTYKNDKGEEGTTHLTLSDIKTNPSFKKSPFKLVVPEGYKKTDDFAP